MYDAEITFTNLSVKCNLTGDGIFNGTALGMFPRNEVVKFSGTLSSDKLNETVSFQYNLGNTCSLSFFNAKGNVIDRLNSTTSCGFVEHGGGPGSFIV